MLARVLVKLEQQAPSLLVSSLMKHSFQICKSTTATNRIQVKINISQL